MIKTLIDELEQMIEISCKRKLSSDEELMTNSLTTMLQYKGCTITSERKFIGGSIPGYVVKITDNNNLIVFDKFYPT